MIYQIEFDVNIHLPPKCKRDDQDDLFFGTRLTQIDPVDPEINAFKMSRNFDTFSISFCCVLSWVKSTYPFQDCILANLIQGLIHQVREMCSSSKRSLMWDHVGIRYALDVSRSHHAILKVSMFD